jgi:soluble lytic murein transglycosylase-like protein
MTWAALEQSLAINQRLQHQYSRPHEAKWVLNKSDKPLYSGDVWERIRLGMKIPRPRQSSQEATLSNHLSIQSTLRRMNQEVSPRSGQDSDDWRSLKPMPAVAPMYNYTPYGRLRFSGAVAIKSENINVKPNDSMAVNNSESKKLVSNQIPRHRSIEPSSALSDALNKPMVLVTATQSNINNQYDRVNKQIIWYSQHTEYLQQVSQRAQPYLFHIVESLSQQQLPAELALLPIVESAYQAKALSPKSAAGLWQFMPSTGHDFDLYQTAHYDARLDIAASTQAAIRYLSFLEHHYNGDWLLALAAYNCGLGMVDNAIERNVALGQGSDYWSLQLPEETQAYVPKFLALSSIFSNPEAYGLTLMPIKNEAYFVKVYIDNQHDVDYLAAKELKEVASLSDLSVEHFKRLNPGYLKAKLAAQDSFTFFMPKANALQFRKRLASIAQFFNKPAAMVAVNSSSLLRKSLLIKAGDNTSWSLLPELQSAGRVAESPAYIWLR